MKFTIGNYTVSISDKSLGNSKESFIEEQYEVLKWMKVDEKVLCSKLGELYDTVSGKTQKKKK